MAEELNSFFANIRLDSAERMPTCLLDANHIFDNSHPVFSFDVAEYIKNLLMSIPDTKLTDLDKIPAIF